MSGLDTAGFDLVVAIGDGALAQVVEVSPDVLLPFNQTFQIGQVEAEIAVDRPSSVLATGGLPPFALDCPFDTTITRNGDRAENNGMTIRLAVTPVVSESGDQVVLRTIAEDSRVADRPATPNLPAGLDEANFDTMLAQALARTIAQVGDIPLHLPAAIFPNTAEPDQAERLGAGFTISGPPAALIGVRTGATHTEPAGRLALPSFLADRSQAGWVVRNGWLAEVPIQQTLRESFPAAEPTYVPESEELRLAPPIFKDGDFEIRSLSVRYDSEAGELLLVGVMRDSGFGWSASGTFVSRATIDCEGGNLRIVVTEPELDINLDVDSWLMIPIGFVLALVFGAIGAGVGFLLGGPEGALQGGAVGAFFGAGAAPSVANKIINPDIEEDAIEAIADTVASPLSTAGPIAVPLPTVVEGLVLEDCAIDDVLFVGSLRLRDPAPVRGEGTQLLRAGFALDLDHGNLFAPGAALDLGQPAAHHDLAVAGGELTPVEVTERAAALGDLRTVQPTRIAITGKSLADLTLVDLRSLQYVWTSLPSILPRPPASEVALAGGASGGSAPAAPGSTPAAPVGPAAGLPQGPSPGVVVEVGPQPWTVFAVRTSEGRFAKCRAREESAGLRLEYVTYEHADFESVAIGMDDAVVDQQPVDVSRIDVSHELRVWAEPVNLIQPLTHSWTLGGQEVPEGVSNLNVAGVDLEIESDAGRLRFVTPLGASLDTTLSLTVEDARARTVSTTRPLQAAGMRFVKPETRQPGVGLGVGPIGNVNARVAAGRTAFELDLPAGSVRSLPRRPNVTLVSATEVIDQALRRSGYDLGGGG